MYKQRLDVVSTISNNFYEAELKFLVGLSKIPQDILLQTLRDLVIKNNGDFNQSGFTTWYDELKVLERMLQRLKEAKDYIESIPITEQLIK